MLPWWFWVLLWTVLVLGTLLFLVMGGIRLFRGFMSLAHDVGEATEKAATAMDAEALPREYPVVTDRRPAGVAALFQDPESAREAYNLGKMNRSALRRAGRVARKVRRGQPQRVADLDLF